MRNGLGPAAPRACEGSVWSEARVLFKRSRLSRGVWQLEFLAQGDCHAGDESGLPGRGVDGGDSWGMSHGLSTQGSPEWRVSEVYSQTRTHTHTASMWSKRGKALSVRMKLSGSTIWFVPKSDAGGQFLRPAYDDSKMRSVRKVNSWWVSTPLTLWTTLGCQMIVGITARFQIRLGCSKVIFNPYLGLRKGPVHFFSWLFYRDYENWDWPILHFEQPS